MLVNTNPTKNSMPTMKNMPAAALRIAVKMSYKPPARFVRSVFASICRIVVRSACWLVQYETSTIVMLVAHDNHAAIKVHFELAVANGTRSFTKANEIPSAPLESVTNSLS